MKKLFLVWVICQVVLFASAAKVMVVKGDVVLERNAQTIKVVSGLEIENKDVLLSKSDGKAQLKFQDGTVVTIGKNTNFSVQEYLYDDANSKADLSVKHGVFKVITGKISKIAPQNFKLQAKTSSIGIRGTIFAGEVTNDYTTIACTEGAITVTIDNQIVDVDAGKMVTVHADGRVSPIDTINSGFLQKISTSDKEKGVTILTSIANTLLVGSDAKVNQDAINNIVEQITQIENADLRSLVEKNLNDMLADQHTEVLDGLYYKVTAPLSMQPNYSDSDANYAGIVWGFYTKNSVSTDTSVSFDERLEDALPKATWVSTPLGEDIKMLYTPYETVSNYIGYTDTTGNFAPHWDGTVKNRVLGIYEGKVLAINDFNEYQDSNGFPTNPLLLSATASNTLNQTFLRVDYGNKSFSSSIKYDIQNASDSTMDHWTTYLVGLGETSVTPSQLSPVATINSEDSEKLHEGLFNFSYLGSRIQQILANFSFDSANYSLTYGNAVFNLQELINLSPKKVDENSDFSWGYWASDDVANKSENEILAANPNGGWVAPSQNMQLTTQETITSLMQSQSQLSYSGNMIGTVYSTLNNTTELIKNGAVNFDFNFAQQSYSGNIVFDTNSAKWDLAVNNGVINGNSFYANSFTQNSVHTAGTPFYGETNGKIYGDGAQNIAGGFEIMSKTTQGDIKTAIGAFTASSQNRE